jgi:protein TonB
VRPAPAPWPASAPARQAPGVAAQGTGFQAALWASAALHVLVWLPWLLLAPARPAPPALLVVDLAGVLSQHQQAAQTSAPPPPPPARVAPSPAPAPREHLAATPQPKPAPTAADSPVPTPAESPAAAPAPPPVVAAAASLPQASSTHLAQTIQAPNTQEDALRRYLGGLKKAVQAQLTYPEQARGSGANGAPVIGFRITESGELQAGSLTLRRSSGHPALDENALAAARASAPWAPPPRAMEVVIAVNFAREALP